MVDSIIFYIYTFMQVPIMVFQWGEIGKPKKRFAVNVSIICIAILLHDFFFQYIIKIGRADFPANVIQTIILSFLICILYEGGVKEKLKLLVSTAVVSIAVEWFGLFILNVIFGSTIQFSEPSELFSVMLGISCDIMLICSICSIIVIRRKDENYKRLRMYFMVMIGYALVHMIFFIYYYTNVIDRFNNRDIIVQLVFQGMLQVLLIILYYTMKKNLEKLQTEEMLIQIEESMKKTHEYYNLAKDKFDDISKIRHDLNNHIRIAKQFILEDQKNEAQEIMEDISRTLEEIKAVQYCSNPLINTILTTKANEPAYKSIDMQFVMKDCERIPCDAAELCSLFSNLFDNAAKAALESGEEPVLQMESGIVNEYFVLKVTNTAREGAVTSGVYTPTTKNNPGHGYGLSIIEMIARKYGGSFVLEQTEVFVTATVMLICQ